MTSARDGGYVPFNPETARTGQGETAEEGLANLMEVVDFFFLCGGPSGGTFHSGVGVGVCLKCPGEGEGR